MEFLEAKVTARGFTVFQTSQEDIFKKRHSVLMAAALPSSTLSCSQSAKGKRFAERWQQTGNEDRNGHTQRCGGWATGEFLSPGSCSRVYATPVPCKGNVPCPQKILSDLVQELLDPSWLLLVCILLNKMSMK